MKKSQLLIVILILLLTFAAIVAVLLSEDDDPRCWSLEIEGMPCIYVYCASGEVGNADLTCNWSKWKGNQVP